MYKNQPTVRVIGPSTADALAWSQELYSLLVRVTRGALCRPLTVVRHDAVANLYIFGFFYISTICYSNLHNFLFFYFYS